MRDARFAPDAHSHGAAHRGSIRAPEKPGIARRRRGQQRIRGDGMLNAV